MGVRLALGRNSVIQSAWLVRVLAGSDGHRCDDCGARMFVKGRSGLCPLCFTHRRMLQEHADEVASAEAGVALHDWAAPEG